MHNNNRNKHLKKLALHIPFLAVLLISVFFAYWGLQNSYFEQDEWHSFGNYNFLLSLKGPDFIGNMLVSDFPYHFAPLSLIFKMNLYQIFSLNTAPYFIVSIFIHFLVSVSVYLLVLMFTKKKLAAFLGALFFALNSSHYQAVTWIGTFEGVQFSVLFGSLSLFSYLIYLKRKEFKFLLLTSGLLLTGLLFKETALTFLLLLGLLAFFNKSIKAKVTSVMSVVSVFSLYVLLRFTYLLFGVKAIPVSGIQKGDDLVLALGYNFFTSSVKIFAQVFFPNEILVYISNIASSPFNIYQYLARGPWVIENGFRYDLLILPSGLLVIVSILWLSRKLKDRQPIYLGLGIILFTIFPLLALSRYLTYLDSRYLYPATVGLSLIIGSLSVRINTTKDRMLIGFSLLVLLLIFSFHLFLLKETVNKIVKVGQTRKSIISNIVTLYPRLPSKTIFYTSSNSSFYGTTEKERIMPFQSGFGQLLLIKYNPMERFPIEFFKNEFLWNITDQGYKEFEGRGFGYFRDFDLMAETFKSKKLPLNAVIAFDYDSESGSLISSTDKIQKRLVGFMTEKEEIEIKGITTNANETNIGLAFDGDSNTFWDSKLPVVFNQNLFVNLGNIQAVASVSINSRSSVDQNRNGYQLLVSEDGQNWQEVFYEKLYPPKEDLVNIYFIPQKARFLNIKQIGDHKYANWVINEIKIYRAINKDEDNI